MIGSRFGSRLRTSTCLAFALALQCALATGAAAQTANEQPADDQASADNGSDTDIVVTAQRRSERLQDVPIAITAIGADTLSERGVSDISDLRGSVPALSISSFSGVNATNLIAIRGVSGQPLPIGAGQATAIYLDGIYLSRPDAGFFALDDVERIEVLRGPQGTLYGRNATAGAINIVTREPSDTTRGGIDVSYGNYDTFAARGSLSGGLGEGVSGSLSGSYDRHDGYFTNSATGNRLPGRESYTLRGKLRFESGDFDATLAGDHSGVNGGELFKNLIVGGVYVGIGDPDTLATDMENLVRLRIRADGASLTMNLRASDALSLTSISAWRRTDALSLYDGDGSSTYVPATATGGKNHSETFSQELRGVITLPRFRATVGANYYHENGTYGMSILPIALTPNYVNPADTTKLDAIALFGQFEYDLAPRLTVIAGLRYNHENRDFVVDYTGVGGARRSGTITDDVLLPSIGINFRATDNVLLYAKASEGYQAPGFNFAPGTVAPANTFGAERLWAYEAGIKSQFLDRAVTLNVAGFIYDYSDMQIRSVVGIGTTIVDNASSARIKGVDVELIVRPARGFTISGQVAYTDATYGSFCQPISVGTPQAADPLCSAGIADRTGNRLNQAPRWSGGINASFETPLSDHVTFRANAGYSFESSVFYTTANEVPASNPDGWTRLDARVGVAFSNGFEVYAFGRNLTDDRYVGQVFRIIPTVVLGALSEPRTYGIGARYRF